jgi:hypothetical protein
MYYTKIPPFSHHFFHVPILDKNTPKWAVQGTFRLIERRNYGFLSFSLKKGSSPKGIRDVSPPFQQMSENDMAAVRNTK